MPETRSLPFGLPGSQQLAVSAPSKTWTEINGSKAGSGVGKMRLAVVFAFGRAEPGVSSKVPAKWLWLKNQPASENYSHFDLSRVRWPRARLVTDTGLASGTGLRLG